MSHISPGALSSLIHDAYLFYHAQIEVIRLEKRLDDELLYLRDAPAEYSTFPEDMEPEVLPEGTPTPINDIVVPLSPKPWTRRFVLHTPAF